MVEAQKIKLNHSSLMKKHSTHLHDISHENAMIGYETVLMCHAL